MAESRGLGDAEADLARQTDDVEQDLRDLLLRIPNVPAPDAPDGKSRGRQRRAGAPWATTPTPTASTNGCRTGTSAPPSGILDNERAVKISGSMFTMLRGLGRHDEPGAVPARPRPQRRRLRGDPPAVARHHGHAHRHGAAAEVRRRRLRHRARRPLVHPDGRGAAHVDRARRDLRRSRPADALHGLHAVLPPRGRARPGATPAACCAATSSTRSRSSPTPRRRRRPAVLDELLARGVSMIEALGLAYRILDISTGDLGQSHHRSIDIEVYAPGCDQWLEVSSVSWFGDYQARRGNIRYRPAGAKGTEVLHTLNGSALAVPAGAGRHPGDLPPARRLGGDPRAAVALHPRRPRDPGPPDTAPLCREPNRAKTVTSATRRSLLREAFWLSHSLATSASAFLSTSISTIIALRPSVVELRADGVQHGADRGRGLGLGDEGQHRLGGDDVLVVVEGREAVGGDPRHRGEEVAAVDGVRP